jgi:ribonucleotide monophosphatase NagD (HAD superfamily)
LTTIDKHFYYLKLIQTCITFRLLLDGATLIAIHKSRYYKTAEGLALGPGPFVAALEYASGATAQVVGKPTKEFFLSSLKDMGVEPHETVMIGDVSIQ